MRTVPLDGSVQSNEVQPGSTSPGWQSMYASMSVQYVISIRKASTSVFGFDIQTFTVIISLLHPLESSTQIVSTPGVSRSTGYCADASEQNGVSSNKIKMNIYVILMRNLTFLFQKL